MRVLYFGDSHLKCIIDAAAGNPAKGAREAFFGATQPHLAENAFSVVDGVLSPSHPKVRETFLATGGSEVIDLKQYDACVISSWCSHVMFMFRLLGAKQAHLPMHLFSIENASDYLLSENVYRAFLRQGLTSYWAFRQVLDQGFSGKVVLFQRPLQSEDGTAHAHSRRPDANRLKKRIYEDLCAEYAAALGERGAVFLPQPEETITADLATRREYSIGSVKLYGEGEHPKHDVAHMNDKYGLLCLRKIRAELGYQ